MYTEITWEEFKKKFLENKNKFELIDVREKFEFDYMKIEWSKLIEMWDIWNRLQEIDWTKEVIFICRSWARSWYITKILSEKWYNWKNLAGWIEILKLTCEECMG